MIEEIVSLPVMDKSLQNLVNVSGLLDEADILTAFSLSTPNENAPSVTDMLKTWISQPGYPVILVNTYIGPGVNDPYVSINQTSSTHRSSAWPVMLSHTSEEDVLTNNTPSKLWLRPGNVNVTIPLYESTGWVIYGYQQSGYFRVNYDERNWKLITQQLWTNHTIIPIETRSRLLDDAFQFAWAGALDYTLAFNLTWYLNKELDYVPWITAIRNFDQLIRLFRGTETGDKLQNYAAQLFSKYFSAKHRVNGSDHRSKLEKLLATERGCRWGLQESIKFAKSYFKMWQSSSFNFPAVYKPAALCVGIAQDDSIFFDVMDSMNRSVNAADRKVFLSGLACTKEPHHQLYLLRLIFTDEKQNILEHNVKMYLLEDIMRESERIDDIINFIATNYDAALPVVGKVFMDEMWVLLGRNILVEKDIYMVNSLVANGSLLSPGLQLGFKNSLATALISQQNAKRLSPFLRKAISCVIDTYSSSSTIHTCKTSYLMSFFIITYYCLYTAN